MPRKSKFPKIYPVTCHTDHVGPGTTFVALPGTKSHGIEFIAQALQKGAAHIIVPDNVVLSGDILQKLDEHDAAVEVVAHIQQVFAQRCAQAHGNPQDSLTIIGITGTKGKTTTCFIVEHILRTAGHATALLGTVHNQIGSTVLPQALTTPHADYLHAFLAECVKQNVTHVVMEVSAQALTLARVHGIAFAGILFTNFSQEHAEFYATQEEYFAAKCRIFAQCKNTNTPVILNADDEWFAKAERACGGNTFLSVGMHKPVDYAIAVQHSSMQQGLQLSVGTQKIACPKLVGIFNAYNVAMAVVVCEQLGINNTVMQKALHNFAGVKGRMQTHALPNGAQCIIDHAHTPSSFEAVLSTLREHTQDLIAVFGIGGERDTLKRPVLGEVASRYATTIVLTSDNPRSEDPMDIIADIKRGIPEDVQCAVHTVLDREEAIKYAYSISQPDSIIAVLAKGSAEYQEIKGVKVHFSEREIIEAL